MSRKSVKTKRIASAQSLASNFSTDWYSIDYLDNVGFLIATHNVSDNTGTFSIEVRLRESDHVYSEPAALTLDSVPTLSDTNAQFFIDLNQISANQVRLTFSAAGGTPNGTAEIYLHTKSVGA